jgi:heme A synthase
MYTIILIAHSWVRWVALIAAIGATIAALAGPDTLGRHAERWAIFLTITVDIQMVLGLLLYLVLSPVTTLAMKNFGAAMKNPQLRFWAVEHLAMMMLAVILVHVGRVLARKAPTPEAKRMRLAVCFGFATMAMLFGMPWPGFPNGRPLFRF